MFTGIGAFDDVLGVELVGCQDEDEVDGDGRSEHLCAVSLS